MRERALGEDVLKSLTPGQQVVKIVHEELSALMGTGDSRLVFSPKSPTVILLAGLQGRARRRLRRSSRCCCGTTGRHPPRRGRPAAAGGDRPAPAARGAVRHLGLRRGAADLVAAVHKGLERAAADGRDTVILDTVGRLHVDEELMDELARVRKEARPHNVLLVLDSMTGQEAVRRRGVPGARVVRRCRADEARR